MKVYLKDGKVTHVKHVHEDVRRIYNNIMGIKYFVIFTDIEYGEQCSIAVCASKLKECFDSIIESQEAVNIYVIELTDSGHRYVDMDAIY